MTATASGKPFENTRMAVFLRKRIDELAAVKSQREIATQAGYEKPNIISMFKRGETKVPFDKVGVLADALDVDFVDLLLLQLDQPGGLDQKKGAAFIDRLSTKNQHKGVLTAWRNATGGKDPDLSEKQVEELEAFFKQFLSPVKLAASK